MPRLVLQSLSITLVFLLVLTGCAAPVQAPEPANLPAQSDTAAAQFPPTYTITPPLPTQTRAPTRVKVTPTPTAHIIPVMTYTFTPLGQAVQPPTSTPTTKSGKATATKTATSTPNVPTDTETPSGPTDTATPTTDAGTVISQSMADKSTVSAGQVIQITWVIKNTGSSTWSSGYALKWFGGLKSVNMYPANTLQLTSLVPPGGTISLTVSVKAPAAPGAAFTMWYLQNTATGLNFIKTYLEVIVPGPTPTL